MGHSLSYSITTTAESSTSITKRLVVTYNSTGGVSDTSNTLSVTGDWPNSSGAVSISIPYGGGSQTVYDQSQAFSKAYGSTPSKSFSASLSGINYWGTTVSTSGSTTIPARAYSLPTAPSSVSATRVSDAQFTVGWTNNSTGNSTTSAPYASQSVQRWDNVTNAWATIATGLSGAATSYTDSTTVANRRYQYRIVAINSSGSATSSASSAVQTTPNAPTTAAANRSGSDIIVTFTEGQSSGMSVTFEIYDLPNGGAAVLLATVASGLGTYTHTSPNAAQTHQYKVRAKSAAGTTLYSTYATTGVVQLLTAPNAPTGLGPTTPADASESRTLSWTHNPIDTTAQRKFQVRHRASGGSWTTETAVTSDTSSWVLAGGTYSNGTTVEWEVRTWGSATSGGSDGTGASVYSATASFVTSARPTATISAPADAGTLTDSTIAAAWTYYQAASSAQAQWRVTLLDGTSATLEIKSGAGTAASTTMATPGQDGETYTIRVEVASTVGLWSIADESTFDVSYLPPSEVEAALSWDRNSGTVQLTLTKAAWDDVATVEPVSATIDRSDDGGDTWTRVATEVALGDTTAVIDTQVPTLATAQYRVTAISALPSTFVGASQGITINETERAYLGYGPSFATILVFYGNLSLSSKVERAEVVEVFAGRVGSDNRPAGVVISGETRTRDVGVAARFINADGFAVRDDFEDASLAGGLMLYRDPTGRVLYGRLSGLNTSESISIFGDVTFTMTEATGA
jgi:hypothetical protein